MDIDFEASRLKNAITECKSAIIVPHVNPDGDAIGSCLALFHELKSYGIETCVVSPNEYPDFLWWLSGNDQVLLFSKSGNVVKEKFQMADICFCLDFNELKRCGELEELVKSFNGKKVLIDHHPNPEQFTDFIFSDTNVSSTAELLAILLEKLNLSPTISYNTAECLLTGIITDTGVFSHNSSRPETFKTIANLLQLGVDKDKIIRNIYDRFSENRMRLFGYVLFQKMKVLHSFYTAYISISTSELKQFTYKDGDTEGFVNYPLSIKGIIFSAIFIEKQNYTKVSFRSVGNFSVSQFAHDHFSGGGHINASGGRIDMPLEKAIQFFESLLPLYQDILQNTSE